MKVKRDLVGATNTDKALTHNMENGMSKAEIASNTFAFESRSTRSSTEIRDSVDGQLSRLLGTAQLLSAVKHEALSAEFTPGGLAFRLELLSELIVECVEALHLLFLSEWTVASPNSSNVSNSSHHHITAAENSDAVKVRNEDNNPTFPIAYASRKCPEDYAGDTHV